MRLLQLLSVVLSLVFTAFAGVAAPGHHLSATTKSVKTVQAQGLTIKNFLIPEVYIYSIYTPANITNTTISFVFIDLNSNTSTTCTDSWTTKNGTSNAPFSYVLCSPTAVQEYFQWQFTSYSGLNNFQIEFAHIFSDPVDYPPPFDVVEYFSAPTNFTLACSDAAGLSGCSLPASKSPVHAIVDGISS